jgi:hypothetical protein
MVRKLALACWVVIFGVAGAAPPAVVAPDGQAAVVEPLGSYVPPDVDVFVSIRNPAHFAMSLREGKLGEPLRGIGLGNLLEQLVPAMDGEGEVVFALRTSEMLPQAFILARAGGVDFDAMVETNVESIQEYGVECTIEEIDDIVVYDFTVAGLPLFSILTAGERVAFATGDGADAVLELMRKDGDSFSDTAAFKALHRAADDGAAEAMSYLRADPVWDLLRAALAGQAILGDPGVVETILGWILTLADSDLIEGAGAAGALGADEELGGEFTVQLKR